ncbi:MAG TPA: Hsp70 family protein, partial [Bryobacteraceae bacterium]|nr:Hsp70 family protein [Bryobacteraceae bacterium]
MRRVRWTPLETGVQRKGRSGRLKALLVMNIGIDLGTTNSALAYIDPAEASDAGFPPIHTLSIDQTVAPGRIEARKTLPSFLFLGEETFAGAYAREQGALVPTKSVSSAKSWLSNPDVDRTARILPWDAQEAGRVLSPVEASTHYLRHIRSAWERQGRPPLSESNVILTVPASFDEEARELTVAAAAEAGIERLTLVEEPAAAFYSWIAGHLSQSQKHLFDGQIVLVCDVGGGTSDFTLIRVGREGDRVEFTRTAVGQHLLLGGDNLDLTLTWLVEAKLGTTLSLRQRSALRRQCAAAKERLLGPEGSHIDRVEITVLGGGAGLVGGTLKTEITRAEVLELALDGFLPFCDLTDTPKEEKRSVFRELGLPYVTDPAITRHLAAFLQTSGARPDAILFNGGFFIPDVLRERVAQVMERWYGQRPLLLENQELDLAVAIGAAYYSYVRSTGAGLVVRGGLPRTYYLGIHSQANELRAVCLVPRGTEEGEVLEIDREDLQLLANKPVSFRLYSSLSRTEDKLGDTVIFTPEEAAQLHLHAPLNAVIRFGRKTEERAIPVKLGARLNEVGTLEIWADSRISDHRWRLQFELRKQVQSAASPSRPAAVVSDEGLVQARRLIEGCFGPAGMVEPRELPSKLETALALGRNSWPLPVIRQLSDWLFEYAEGRGKSAAHEVRWLNLSGWCLRPGFGFPGDDLRIEQARRIYASGLRFPTQVENETQWWIFCGRIAGGMNRNQQIDVFQRLSPFLLPKGQKKQRVNPSLLREMWRTAASLELLPLQTKTDLGEALLKKLKEDGGPSEIWCISRIGARKLFYGPNNQVVSPTVAARWVDALLKLPRTDEALASIAQVTGDVARDLPPAAVN